MSNRNKYCETCKKIYDKYYFEKHKCIPVEQQKNDKVCQKCKRDFEYASLCKRHEKSCLGPMNAWNDVFNPYLTTSVDKLKKYVNNHYLQGESDDSDFIYAKMKAFINKVTTTIVKNKKNCTFKWTNDLKNVRAAIKGKNSRWKREKIFFLDDICSVYKKAIKDALDHLNDITEGALWQVCHTFKNLDFNTIVTSLTGYCQERLQRDLPR